MVVARPVSAHVMVVAHPVSAHVMVVGQFQLLLIAPLPWAQF